MRRLIFYEYTWDGLEMYRAVGLWSPGKETKPKVAGHRTMFMSLLH